MPHYFSYPGEDDNMDAEPHESLIEKSIHLERRTRCKTCILCGCLLAVTASFFRAFVIFALHSWRVHGDGCVLGNERIFTDVPIVYEYKRFKRAGFHDTKHDDRTIYEGKPNKDNNAAWERLLQVGVVAISREENAKLVNGSAKTPANPNEYMVELEMFHQLHCLKWIRDQLWELEEVASGSKSLDEFSQRTDHNDHCIDYLRQSIMCHGDVTPITFEWNSEISNYLAHHSTEHQCRNFDKIFDWAEGRARTGLATDGAHQNLTKFLIVFAAAVAAAPPAALPVDGHVTHGDSAALEDFKRTTYTWIKREISEAQADAYKRASYTWIKCDDEGSSY
ncbi:hypothetical protein F5Y03DRAFT_392539 [Xylaria venustula]|nr:hypothetical protein F5Y03DRAFT_392539 [Xylaria venustula]